MSHHMEHNRSQLRPKWKPEWGGLFVLFLKSDLRARFPQPAAKSHALNRSTCASERNRAHKKASPSLSRQQCLQLGERCGAAVAPSRNQVTNNSAKASKSHALGYRMLKYVHTVRQLPYSCTCVNLVGVFVTINFGTRALRVLVVTALDFHM